MVKIKLAELAQKLNKTITDIAKDTGINRNTITALYHNKVDGIKFPTLEKICEKYGVNISDLLEVKHEEQREGKSLELYRQEGEIVPFTVFAPMMTINDMDSGYFADECYGQGNAYFKKNYGLMYWQKDSMTSIAKHVYNNLVKTNRINDLYSDFVASTKEVETLYDNLNSEKIYSYTNSELKDYSDEIWQRTVKFWSYGIFIDGFDAGFDQEEIGRIAKENNLSIEEIGTLTTPMEMTFNNERLYALLKIVKKIKLKRIESKKFNNWLKKYVKENSEINSYIKKFDYYKSNFSHINHIQYVEVETEIKKYLSDSDLFKVEYNKLKNYSQAQQGAIDSIVKKHKLDSNPLEFFAKLTYWRELRKGVNLMAVYILYVILESIERKTGILVKHLKYLSFDEIDHVLKGLISGKVLKRRYEEGILITINDHSYTMIEGKEAESLKDGLEKRLTGDEQEKIISGFVASQGYAKGIARVVLDLKDFDKFKEGEILITGMTRPEFIPVMKRSAAIVTNEGGITCHAAIVSRELGKPCIIGTQNATKLINDGDLIEVRANHGTVRILKRAR